MAEGDDFDFVAAVVALGTEFARRGMSTNAAALRRYYLELRDRERRRKRQGDRPTWSDSQVLLWLMLFRIPPFVPPWPVLPRGSPCPGCGQKDAYGAPITFTRISWSGGGPVVGCRLCSATWMVEG